MSPTARTTRQQLRVASHLLSSSAPPQRVTRMKVHLPSAVLLLLALQLSGEPPRPADEPPTAHSPMIYLDALEAALLVKRDCRPKPRARQAQQQTRPFD